MTNLPSSMEPTTRVGASQDFPAATTGSVPGSSSGSSSGSSGDAGKGAQAAMTRVADEAPAQAARVVEDAKSQISTAAHQTLSDLRTTGDSQAERAATGLRGLASQADALAAGRPEEAGKLGDFAQALGERASSFAEQLDTRGVQGMVDDASRFGRQHPWAFLGMALGAGFVVGRVVRTTAAVSHDNDSGQANHRNQTSMGSPSSALGQSSMAAPTPTMPMSSPAMPSSTMPASTMPSSTMPGV